MTREGLKPCPFCGSPAVLGDGPWVYCSDWKDDDPANCPAKPMTDKFDTQAEAIAAWNTRADTRRTE